MAQQRRTQPQVYEVNGHTVTVAPYAGFCYGVTRACDLTEQALAQRDDVYCLGHLIHNPQVVSRMAQRGLRVVDGLDGVDGGVLVIRSHGVEAATMTDAQARQMTLVDATCPFVKKAQQTAVQMEQEGRRVVLIGEKDHPEVRGILSRLRQQPLVLEAGTPVPAELHGARLGVLAQTTQNREAFETMVESLRAVAGDIRVANTICQETRKRQQAARALAGDVDVMLIIGGKNSANTARLAELCRASGCATYHIETAAEVLPEMVQDKPRIGLAAGASTPGWLINEVRERVAELLRGA